jgi:hypothetical protein
VGKLTSTHTYAELELSQSAYDEIARKLREAGYDHSFMDDGVIDMHGIGVTRAETSRRCTVCGWIVDTESKPEFPLFMPEERD